MTETSMGQGGGINTIKSTQHELKWARQANMPSTSVTQHDSMDLGYPHVSVIDISIVGLQLKIYGLEEIKGSNLPVAAVVGPSHAPL